MKTLNNLEERVDRAGLTHWYVCRPPARLCARVVVVFETLCLDAGFTPREAAYIADNSNAFKAMVDLEYLKLLHERN